MVTPPWVGENKRHRETDREREINIEGTRQTWRQRQREEFRHRHTERQKERKRKGHTIHDKNNSLQTGKSSFIHLLKDSDKKLTANILLSSKN